MSYMDPVDDQHADVLDVEGEEVTTRSTVASLVPLEQSALVRPAGTPNEVAQVFDDYQELCKRLLDDSDFEWANGKRFTKRSGWRKLAVAFGVTFHIQERTISRDAYGNVQWAEFIVRALAPGGRYADGWGSCSLIEKPFSKPNHDIPATAETRAKNRAAADLFGMGSVSAEEIGVEAEPVVQWPEGFSEETVERSRAVKARIEALTPKQRELWDREREQLDLTFEKGLGYSGPSLDLIEGGLTLIEAVVDFDTEPASTEPDEQPPAATSKTIGDLHELFKTQQAAIEKNEPVVCGCGEPIAENAAVFTSETGIIYHEKCKPW